MIIASRIILITSILPFSFFIFSFHTPLVGATYWQRAWKKVSYRYREGSLPSPSYHRVSLSMISNSLSMIIRIAVIRFNVLILLSCLPLFWCHKKKRESFYGKSKLAANKAYDDFVARLYTEKAPEPGSIPFKALAEEWLETYKRDAVRNVTLEKTYESPLNRHILPYFGTMLVARITETDIKNSIQTILVFLIHICPKCAL